MLDHIRVTDVTENRQVNRMRQEQVVESRQLFYSRNYNTKPEINK